MRSVDSQTRQSGVALITAMLVVALATAAGVAIATRQHVDIRRSENLFHSDQALQFAYGGEAWAMAILARDRKDNDIDHLGEDWAKRIPPLPVDGGSVSGYIEDMQGRFNLNNLNASGSQLTIDLDRLRRILEDVGLDASLADAIADWVDEDNQPRFPDGAEDESYFGNGFSYRTANRPMASASELRLIKGFTAEAVEKLLPYVCALPVPTGVNLNTASEAVLQALFPALDSAEIKQIIEEREREAFASVQTFQQFYQATFSGKQPVSDDRLAVSSEFFIVTSDARIGNARLELTSLVQRTGASQLAIVSRSFGGM